MWNGIHLMELRSDLGLSQLELAKETNVGQTEICKYERNTRTPSVNFLLTLAEKYRVSIDYFMEISKTRRIGTVRRKNAKEIGTTIKNKRKSLGLSQEIFADLIYITRRQLIAIENGNTAIKCRTIMALNGKFDLSFDEILLKKAKA